MKPETLLLIQNHELFTHIKGGWSSFHDCCIESFNLSLADPKRQDKASLRLGINYVEYHVVWADDIHYEYEARNNFQVVILFDEISGFTLDGVGGPSIISDLCIENESGIFSVYLESISTFHVRFTCANILVESVTAV